MDDHGRPAGGEVARPGCGGLMGSVNGVLGPIEAEDLGFTLMHEHILIANWSMRQSFADWVDVEKVVAHAADELVKAREVGVRTVCDLTPINLGRDVHVIREVAARAGVNVIASTGLYYHQEPWLDAWPPEKLVDWLIRDIADGIQGTDAKAGLIKCATNEAGVTDFNKKLLQTAARLHRATGVPISTHTDVHCRAGLGQQDVFEEEGVDLSRVVIGHCGDSEDIDYLGEILDRGSVIGMDRFGLDMVLPTEKRVGVIAELCRAGRADQIVLSHDACCHIDFFPDMSPELMAAMLPNWNFRHVPCDVVPALRKNGVTEEQIRAMTVDNPRRIFERQGAY
jgi:phosphotriesterase-related protein